MQLYFSTWITVLYLSFIFLRCCFLMWSDLFTMFIMLTSQISQVL